MPKVPVVSQSANLLGRLRCLASPPAIVRIRARDTPKVREAMVQHIELAFVYCIMYLICRRVGGKYKISATEHYDSTRQAFGMIMDSVDEGALGSSSPVDLESTATVPLPNWSPSPGSLRVVFRATVAHIFQRHLHAIGRSSDQSCRDYTTEVAYRVWASSSVFRENGRLVNPRPDLWWRVLVRHHFHVLMLRHRPRGQGRRDGPW